MKLVISQSSCDGFMRIDTTLPFTNLCDVLQQSRAGCSLGILIRDIMMKGRCSGEAPCISLSNPVQWPLNKNKVIIVAQSLTVVCSCAQGTPLNVDCVKIVRGEIKMCRVLYV